MISVFSPSNKLIKFELWGNMAKFGGCKLRYFVVKRRKTLGPSYYWNAKGMEKYGLPNHQALGNDYQRAVANWQALYFEYCRRRRETKIYGFCTEQDKGLSDNKGTLIHMRELYFKDRRFLRLADKTKKDYTKTLENVVDKLLYKTQKAPLGTILVKDINRPFIKALYEKLLEKTQREFSNELDKVLCKYTDNQNCTFTTYCAQACWLGIYWLVRFAFPKLSAEEVKEDVNYFTGDCDYGKDPRDITWSGKEYLLDGAGSFYDYLSDL